MKNLYQILIILSIIATACSSPKEAKDKHSTQLQPKYATDDTSSVVKKVEDPKPREKEVRRNKKKKENVIYIHSDTIKIVATGKVLAPSVINDSLYCYRVFNPSKLESDEGTVKLMVKQYPAILLWSKAVGNEIVLHNNRSILTVNLETSMLHYYDLFNGDLLTQLNIGKEYPLSDANNFVLTNEGLYIKLVKPDGYSFRDILFIKDSNLHLLNVSGKGYLKLLKREGKAVLLNNKDSVMASFE